MAGLTISASRKLFAALPAFPLATAFSSTSLLFLPGGSWDQDQRLVSSMGQVFLPLLPNKLSSQAKSENFGLMIFFSSSGKDATATTWAVTCTSTKKCDLPSPYLVYTLGESTAHWIQTDTAPN